MISNFSAKSKIPGDSEGNEFYLYTLIGGLYLCALGAEVSFKTLTLRQSCSD